MQILLRAFLIISLGIYGCGQMDNKTVNNNSLSGSDIEKVKLNELNDIAVDLTKYKGKTVFINFWATWCKPCLEEMPSIQKAIEMLKDENVEFLFASNESSEQIENFKSEHDYGFNYVKAENLEDLNIMGLPTTFIFDQDGKLVFSEVGYRKWDDKTNIDLILNISNTK